MNHSRSGVALLTTLAIGVILMILALSLLALYYEDFTAQRRHQQALQAYWYARSGLERFCDQRELPKSGRVELTGGSCEISKEGEDLVFTGVCGSQRRTLRLLGSDPRRRLEP